ncbi:MAG: hypothetical protein E7192_01870 [Erysipelotrichaceae bacterium]|nr:hypothetical protein [Erysipelotrichaceae bacterium]
MKKSTRKLLNLKWIDKFGIHTYDKMMHCYFLVNPLNLSVLSNDVIMSHIYGMINLLKGCESLEIIALNQRENFERNKVFLKSRIEKEENEEVKKLLQYDLIALDQMQSETAASRMFLMKVQFRKVKDFDYIGHLNRIEKSLANNGFDVRRCTLEDIMTMMAVYSEQNFTSTVFDKIDGERWLINDLI